MTALHEVLPSAAERPVVAPWWRVAQIWASVAIVAMWLAVLFVGVYGNDMTFVSTGNGTTVIPSGVAVAVCAAFATASIARRAFGAKRSGPE